MGDQFKCRDFLKKSAAIGVGVTLGGIAIPAFAKEMIRGPMPSHN